MACGIYKITSPTNKVYIGSSVNIDKRWRSYKRLSCKNQVKLYNSLKKYGHEAHTFEILEECNFDELYRRERYYGEKFNSIGDNGLNLVLPSDGEVKAKYSDETRIKLSQLLKGERNPMYGKTKELNSFYGKTHTEESKQKLSKSIKKYYESNKNWNYGNKYSEERKAQMSLTAKSLNIKLSEEHKKTLLAHSKSDKNKQRLLDMANNQSEKTRGKISQTLKGRKRPLEVIEKIRLGNKGKKMSVESKHKMSENSKMSKVIINVSNGVFYYNIKEAANSLNINYSTLRCKLSGANINNTPFVYA
jgi:group I intron endonuclease